MRNNKAGHDNSSAVSRAGFSEIVFILIIVGLVGVVGFFVYQKKQTQPVAVEVSSPTADPTVNWETYVDEQFFLSIKYPKLSTLNEGSIRR